MGETRKPGRNPRQGITAKAAKLKPGKPSIQWRGGRPGPRSASAKRRAR